MAPARKLRVGVAGLGRGFTLMRAAFATDPRIALRAAADPRAEARERFQRDFSARAYASVEELCEDETIEVIYVATPHQHHASHVAMAAACGKHVLVEKPMALTVEDCRAMIDAAAAAKVHLLVGHSHSFDAPIRRAREIIQSGEVGPVRMINAFNFTDFLYRPRRSEELDTRRGGGVLFSQAAHQVDIVRLIGGGRVRAVRAAAGSWDPARPTEGAYSALLTFQNGVFGSMVYSGYAHFDSDEFCGWIDELGRQKDPERYGAARGALARAASAEDEARMKDARAYGAASGSAADRDSAGAPRLHEHFGVLLVSCDHADLRPLPTGVMVYGDRTQRLEPLPPSAIARSEVIDELYAAAVFGEVPLHSGAWGLATLEVCLAMLRSAREQREIALEHQAGLDDPNPSRGLA